MFEDKFFVGQFMSVYDDTEADGQFHVCRYLCEDDDFILFQTISTRGYDDGFYLIPVESVNRVDVDDAYTKRIVRLFALQQQPVRAFDCSGEPLLVQFLNHAMQKYITSVFLEDGENVTGRILSIHEDDDFLYMEKLSEDGHPDGTAYIRMDCIEKIICDSGVERMIEMLMDEVSAK